MADPIEGCSDEATFRMPSSMGFVVNVPSRIGLVRRNPGVATPIRCNQGSLALMMHFGARKLLEIEM